MATWNTANGTVFQSYPPPNSPECIQFSGCQYEGQFAACGATVSESWVQSHNIVAFFPNQGMDLHALCLKDPSSGKTIRVVVLDTCSDSDCSGCCTKNKGTADALIDVEINTDGRFLNWGINGGDALQWADLGPADPSEYSGCK